jgi:general stress protein 26
MENLNNPSNESNHQYYEMLKTFESCMLITHSKDQTRSDPLCGRPMHIAHVELNCELWFLADRSSEKIFEIRNIPYVYITCQQGQRSFLTLSGTATIVDDRSKVSEIWKEPYRVWFPKGTHDESLILIHVRPEEGEFWNDDNMDKVKYFFRAVKAYATGETPTVDSDQHQKITFS